jgi:hypothetical protein
MKKKKKEQLLVDKKECANCGNILEKDIKVCDECGYDMTMEESLMIYAKKYAKIIKEATTPININLNKNSGKYTKQAPGIPLDPKSLTPGVYQLNVSSDEGKKTKKKKYKYNPWAVCTASVGREDKEKYEKCVMDVKHTQKMHEDLERLSEYIERLITDSEVNPKIKKGNFKQFVSKLK